MKAIILAAGRTLSHTYGFPKNSKPKCLFHYKGEVLLERQARILRKFGIKDVRVVVGYKKEMIENFNRERNLGLKLSYNPSATSDTHEGGWHGISDSMRLGLEGVDDDVIISYGDTYLTEGGLSMLIRDKRPLVVVASMAGFAMFKIAKKYLPQLREIDGYGGIWPIHDFCMVHLGVKDFVSGKRDWCKKRYLCGTGIFDVDYYKQTDEGRLG